MLHLESSLRDICQLIEYLYIIGLHKESKELSILAEESEFYNTIVRDYSAEDPSLDKDWLEVRGEIGDGKNLALLGGQEYEFIAYNAFKLNRNSRILELGTYHGGSTLALCEGSKFNNSQITSVDPFIGFQANTPISDMDAMNWSQNLWQKNVRRHSGRIRCFAGSATSILCDLARRGEKFDLIFYDTAHNCETPFEMALISSVAAENCTLIADDIINHNFTMTTSWAISLKNLYAFPRFMGHLAIANFKTQIHPTNLKFEPSLEQLWGLARGVQIACEKQDLTLISFTKNDGLS